ncbi:MAG: basic amino acid ABC transporter substrate-binding protein [Candidatus Cryosericum sp.]|nr:basic amino acid ABC transporter substrate-binding protein [bacterium]
MKKKAFVRSIVLVVVVALMIVALTGCKAQSGTLNWGTDPTYAPFEYTDENNKPTGFDVELMEAIAAKMGKTSNLTSGAFDGLLLALKGKKFDAVCAAMTITPDRQEEVLFSMPYYRADMGIMYNPAKNDITRPEDLEGKTVGVQTGTTGEIDAKLITGVRVQSYPDIQLATQDLENGKVDAVVNDFPVCAAYASTHPTLKVIDTTSIAGQDLRQLYGIAVRKDDTQLKNDIDAALLKVVADGTYAALYKKYFLVDPPYLPPYN